MELVNDWKRAMVIALTSKNKLCFVDGSLSKPASNSPNYRAWDRVNSTLLVGSWGSWRNWVELGEKYGQSSPAQLFSPKEEIIYVSQGSEGSVAEFFTKMKSLWDEQDNLDP